ncbi:MAG: C39 family peptidase [Candidatus Aminicenantes bacterium]|jgi:hypothetical protein
MNMKLGAFLSRVSLFRCRCIRKPHHASSKPAELALKYKILEVPLFAQATRMWCWAASGEMIMHYYEDEVPQYVQANNRFKRDDCGPKTRSRACIKGGWPEFKKYGFNPGKSKYGALSWKKLVKQFHANQPVGFSWEWKKCKSKKSYGSHYMVARGYIILNDSKLVVVNDPLPANGDKHKGGTISIMTYSDYVQFRPRHKHSYTQYDITKSGSKQLSNQKLLRGRVKNEGWKDRRVEGDMLSSKMRLKASKPCVPENSHELSNIRHFDKFAAGTIHLKKPSVGPKGLIGPPCHGAPGRRRQGIWSAAMEGLGLLKALPWSLQKELGYETETMVEKSKLGKKTFYTMDMRSEPRQDSKDIPGDVLEVHYPVEVERKLVTSITIRKRRGKWKFAVIGDNSALSAVKALNEMIVPREPPAYFMVQIHSMNLSFLAYFLQEEEGIGEDNIILYLTPTHEDPDLTFPLYVPVPAAEVFLELKYLLERMAEEKGGETLKNQFTGYWNKMEKALEELDSGEKNRVHRGLKNAVEIINNVFVQLESQNRDTR